MINKKCYTVGKVPTSNRKISERGKSIPLTHLYMTAHFSDLVQALQFIKKKSNTMRKTERVEILKEIAYLCKLFLSFQYFLDGYIILYFNLRELFYQS